MGFVFSLMDEFFFDFFWIFDLFILFPSSNKVTMLATTYIYIYIDHFFNDRFLLLYLLIVCRFS